MNVLVVAGVTFLAATVEWVEALTIVLAVGLTKGWRSAFTGAILALAALVALILVFGVGLAAVIPIAAARALVGVFLLLFGLKWLQKAVLRSSGLKPLHDESKVFAEERERLSAAKSGAGPRLDSIGTVTSFNGVFLEGLEVVFIVLALGVASMTSASAGALAALAVVATVGAVFRAPLTRVPENTMKYVVGVMLTSFGTFFAGEGIGVRWWDSDLSIVILVAINLAGSLLLVAVLKRAPQTEGPAPHPALRAARAAALQVWGLFVADSGLALFAIVALLAVALFANLEGHRGDAAGLLVLGVVASFVIGVVGPYREHVGRARALARVPGADLSGQSGGDSSTVLASPVEP